MNKINIQHLDKFIELKSYQKYLKEKEKIQKKYPSKPWITSHSKGRGNYKNPYEENWWNDWLKYKQEMIDLLFKPNSNFQQFLWDITGEHEELKAQRAINGYDRSIYYTG